MTVSRSVGPILRGGRTWVLAFLIVLLIGCHGNPTADGGASTSKFFYRDPYSWPVSTPTAQALDPDRISAALQEIGKNSFIYSFLVVKNDSLVLEYYNGFQKDNDFDVHSATKSITSTLIGIAIDHGMIHSVQDKILSFFPDFDTTGLDPRKRDWTIENFLTMRSGFDWDETADHTSIFTNSVNWTYTALRLPLKYAPGEHFLYATPNANILSGILTRVSGMSTYDFAEKYLFTPLQISVRAWFTDPQGIYAGGSSSRFTPRDLARFGQLYLKNGMIGGVQVVSSTWIQQSLMPRNPQSSPWGDFASVNYGYLWWNNYDAQDSVFMAVGFAGQFIFVVPRANMIIATTANDNVTTDQANVSETIIIGIVQRYFLQ